MTYTIQSLYLTAIRSILAPSIQYFANGLQSDSGKPSVT